MSVSSALTMTSPSSCFSTIIRPPRTVRDFSIEMNGLVGSPSSMAFLYPTASSLLNHTRIGCRLNTYITCAELIVGTGEGVGTGVGLAIGVLVGKLAAAIGKLCGAT